MNVDDGAGLLEELTRELEKPRAAMAYGIDTRELRHNAFLHFLLRWPTPPEFSRELVRQIALKVDRGGISPESAGAWQQLAEAEISDIAGYYNVAHAKGKPDEVIVCTAGDRKFSVVVEMKVKAEEYADQLANYVEQERVKSRPEGVKVVGLLLRIPGNDKVNTKQAQLNGKGLRGCIDEAKKAIGNQGADEDNRKAWEFLVDDYQRTLEFLDWVDGVIVRRCGELIEVYEQAVDKEAGPPTLAHEWAVENWRWWNERLAREIANGLPKQDRSVGAYATKDGSALDISLVTDEDLKDLRTPGAYFYFHWKVGGGFEIRAIVTDYHDKPSSESRALMNAIVNCVSGDSAMFGLNDAPSKVLGVRANSNSCGVARWDNSTYDVDTAVTDLDGKLDRCTNYLKQCLEGFGRTRDDICVDAGRLLVYQK